MRRFISNWNMCYWLKTYGGRNEIKMSARSKHQFIRQTVTTIINYVKMCQCDVCRGRQHSSARKRMPFVPRHGHRQNILIGTFIYASAFGRRMNSGTYYLHIRISQSFSVLLLHAMWQSQPFHFIIVDFYSPVSHEKHPPDHIICANKNSIWPFSRS